MKVISILCLVFLISCSHHTHDVESEHISWKQEHKNLEDDNQKIMVLFNWIEKHLKDHQNDIVKHEKEIARHEKALKKKSSSLKAKKTKLEINRLHIEMDESHKHFMEDHEKLMSIIEELEDYKKDLINHDGHDH